MSQKESFYWWSQRVFSAVLIPLTLWFLAIAGISLQDSSLVTISIILSLIKNGHVYLILFFGFLLSTHIRLGLEEAIEDYVHDPKMKLICSTSLRILAIKMIHDLYLWSLHSYMV